MIQLNNITIKYGDNEVITNGNIKLNEGDLCLVSGDSGTGKTSLLNILSLQNLANHSCEYLFNGEDVLAFDEKERSAFLLNNVAFVSQNNLIFGEFTVSENLDAFCEIGYGTIKKEYIEELVSKLNLRKLLNRKAKKLSGGEKQRVAIACAVLKNADIYLFDEPTSMIDIERKEEVYTLLKELAKKGKIVVVVSHELDKALFSKVYCIQNKGFVLEKNETLEVVKEENIRESNLQLSKLCTKLASRFFLSQPLVNALYVLIISICLALIINIFGGAYANVVAQKKAAEVVNNPELFVVNTETFVFTASDEYGAHPISDEDYLSIQNIDHVVSARRYVYLPLEDGIREPVVDDVPSQHSYEESEVVLKIDGEEVSSFNYTSQFANSSYAIYPTYEHQNLDEKCSSVVEGEGIYITKRIANLLGITEVNNQVINLHFSVPIGNVPGYFTDGMTGEVSLRRLMYSVLIDKDFPLKGIVDVEDDYYYSYMHWFNADFFMDIDTIEEIQQEYFDKYEDLLLELSNTPMPWVSFQKYYETRIVDPSIWGSSAVVVHVDENENIDQVISKITKINPNLSVAVKSYGMVDVDKKMTSNVILTSIGYSSVIFAVTIIAVSILKAYRRKNRMPDYVLLNQNGLSSKNILDIENKENYIEMGVILLLSGIMTIAFSLFLKNVLYYSILLSSWMILILILMILVTILGGNVLSKLIKKH